MITDAQAGHLIRTIFRYETGGNVATLKKPAFLMQTFAFIRKDLDTEKINKTNICKEALCQQARFRALDAKRKRIFMK